MPPWVTWFRSPRDGTLHLQAAAAIPQVEGLEGPTKWLVGHSDGRAIFDGDTPLAPEDTARRLGLQVVGDGPAGLPPGPLQDPVTVVMLVCGAAGAPVISGLFGDGDFRSNRSMPSPAAGVDMVTGQRHRLIAPAGDAIMMPDGDMIAGEWVRGKTGLVPEASGDWLVWENGVPRSLGTSSLREAMASLGARLLPSGTPPSQPVAFYNGLSSDQSAALDARGYFVTAEGLDGAASAASFYTSLIAAGGHKLRERVKGELTPDRVRDLIVAEFERDLGSANPRYLDYIAGPQTPDQVLASLRNPDFWDREAADLVPHVAARRFGLELEVLGLDGEILSVTDVTGPRVTDQGKPVLLLRMADGRYVPAMRGPAAGQPAPARPAEGAPAEGAPAEGEHGEGEHGAAPAARPAGPGPWTKPLSSLSARPRRGSSRRKPAVPRCPRGPARPPPSGGLRR